MGSVEVYNPPPPPLPTLFQPQTKVKVVMTLHLMKKPKFVSECTLLRLQFLLFWSGGNCPTAFMEVDLPRDPRVTPLFFIIF